MKQAAEQQPKPRKKRAPHDGPDEREDKTKRHRCTREEMERRSEIVADLLTQQFSRFEIHAKVCKVFKCHWRTVDAVYIVYARKLLRKVTDLTAEQARRKSLEVLWRHVKEGTIKEQQNAIAAIERIYGFAAPRHTVLTSNQDGSVTLTDETVPKPTPDQVRKWAQEDAKIIEMEVIKHNANQKETKILQAG